MKPTTFILAALCLGLPVHAADLELKSGVPIYLAANEPEPIRRAVRDLQRDLRAVLGADSPVISRLEPAAIVVLGPGTGHDTLRHSAVKGRESHGVFVRGPHIVLQGGDTRGAIYAIYTFSQRFLGVPPLWFWASWEPARKSSVQVSAGTQLLFPTPYVRWRAWFPNDEDLLTPWRARSAENYEAFLETMLRLKLNTLEGAMMDSSSFDEPYRAGRQTRLARDRGLAVTGHHIYIFGSSYNNWNLYWKKIRRLDPPALTIANVSALEDFWRYHIETGLKEKLETIWLIGFRGNRDIPFWETFPDAPAGDAERARVIQDMMTRQVALLKKVAENPAPAMRVTLYWENSDFFAQGLLRTPNEPSLILTFVAARRDHFPAPDVRGYRNDANRPIGYYMNFQFTSSGAHLAQAEGPWKMERNFRMVNAISGRPLEFSVVNAGNIREFLLELSANARMMWDFDGFKADAFLAEFCAQYFGPDRAARVAALYRDFFTSYWNQKKPDLPGFERQYLFQDMRYARAVELLLAQLPKGRDPNPLTDRAMETGGRYFRIAPEDNGATSQLEAIQRGTTASVDKLTRVTAAADSLLPALPLQGREFFNDNLRVQARFLLELNRVLQSVAHAVDVLPDKTEAVASLRRAERAANAMRAALSEAEHGRFTGWYEGDRLFGLEKMRQTIARTIEGLGGGLFPGQ
jgi:hypothetical protein